MLECGKQQTLVESLVNAVNAIALSRDYRKSQKRDCFDLVRRIKLLLPLFEELRELQGPLPRVAVECFSSLRKTFHSARRLLQLCHDGSKLYLALDSEAISGRFHALTEELDRILDGIPYDLLEISDEVKEQVSIACCPISYSLPLSMFFFSTFLASYATSFQFLSVGSGFEHISIIKKTANE